MMKSERLLPSINLSVNAILRASGQTVFRQVNAPADRNAQALQPPALVDRRTMDAQAAMSRNPTRESNATAKFVRRDAIASPSSLERIFRRSRSTDARTQMAGTLGHPLEVQQTVAQLVQRSQRIESRPGEPAITTARSFDSTLPVARKEASHSAPTPDHGVEAFDSDSQAPLRTTDSGPDSSVWPDLARARESINIEQITDQVIRRLDQKVVAARERIGRTF
jgi:hypothetical protein